MQKAYLDWNFFCLFCEMLCVLLVFVLWYGFINHSSGVFPGYFNMDSVTQTFQNRMSVKLWPPSQSTRLMLVERMSKNFITPSFISRKYGLLNKEEAEEGAKKIEEMAFAAANQHHEREPDGDGSSAVQIYAKEIGRAHV